MWSAAVEELAPAIGQLQQHLQAFSLHGTPAAPILQHLPATYLTRLCVIVALAAEAIPLMPCRNHQLMVLTSLHTSYLL